MNNNSELQLLAAKINLLNMKVYSECILKMVSYGLLKANDDDAFFQEDIRRTVPELGPDAVIDVAKMKKEMDLDQTLKGAKAASLIFVHAGVESCITDLLKLIKDVSPQEFLPLIKDKKFTIETFINEGTDTLINSQTERYLEALSRQSFVKCTHTVFRLVKPSKGDSAFFDEEKLRRIENLRNDCAHGRVDIADFSTIYDDLQYLFEIGEHFVDLVAKRYKIPNPKFSLEELRKGEQGASHKKVYETQ